MAPMDTKREATKVEEALQHPTPQETTPQAAPWKPIAGIRSDGGAAARRTIASNTHKA